MVQDKLNEHLKSIESKLGSSEEVPAGVGKLDWHLTKIESLAGGDVDAKIAVLKEYVDASIGQAVTNVLTEEF